MSARSARGRGAGRGSCPRRSRPSPPAASGLDAQRHVRQKRLAADGESRALQPQGQDGGAGAGRAPRPFIPAAPAPIARPPGGAFSVSVSIIRMIPSATARPRLPRAVSSVIAVVMVRVCPAMLPPTISTAPTSALARPKPASTPVSRLTRPSHRSVGTARSGPRRASAAARGTRPRDPRPPSGSARRRSAGSGGLRDDHRRRREQKRQDRRTGRARQQQIDQSPATTGGRPISALKTTITAPRPGNRASASPRPAAGREAGDQDRGQRHAQAERDDLHQRRITRGDQPSAIPKGPSTEESFHKMVEKIKKRSMIQTCKSCRRLH
jgi:hypothetical protein